MSRAAQDTRGRLRYALIAGTFAVGTVIGTSASASAHAATTSLLRAPTHAGASAADQRVALRPRESANSVLREIRELTGFTWEQLASLLDVDRRSLHLWVTGGGIRPEHERQLHALRDLSFALNAGNPQDTRAELLTAEFRGHPVWQLLARPRVEVAPLQPRVPSAAARALEKDFDLTRLTTRARTSRAHTPGRVTRTDTRPNREA